MKVINDSRRWIAAHPMMAMGFYIALGYLIGLTVAAFASDEISHRARWWIVGILAAVFVVYCIIYYTGMRKLALLALSAALLSTPAARAAEPPQEEHPALVVGVGVGVGIIGWLWWKIHKCSVKAAKARTNNWPEEVQFQVAGVTEEFGAAFSWAEEGYCYAERTLPKTPTVFTLDLIVNLASNVTMTAKAERGEQFVETFEEAVAGLERRNLSVIDHVGTMESYERGGLPAFPEEVPLSYDWRTHTLTWAPGGILLVVERSTDLEHWETFGRFNVGEGAKLTLPDVGGDATFYRWSVQ